VTHAKKTFLGAQKERRKGRKRPNTQLGVGRPWPFPEILPGCPRNLTPSKKTLKAGNKWAAQEVNLRNGGKTREKTREL